jgi:lipopolysaccharide transport system permease protein
MRADEAHAESLDVAMRTLIDRHMRHYLIRQYLNRQFNVRYKGRALGVLWSLVSPLLMLLVYTFVFGTVLHSRYGLSKSETTLDYGLALFCGLNLFNFWADVMTQSPGLILSQPNLVKKVVFPLEILPLVNVLDALFHCVLAFVPLFFALILVHGGVPWSFCLLPLFLLPTMLIALGFGLFLSAIGVFVRDIQNFVPTAVTVLMFGSAIFYPLAFVPDWIRAWFSLNPLAVLIENARKTLVWGMSPDIGPLLLITALGLAFAIIGFFFFEKSRPAFADVI